MKPCPASVILLLAKRKTFPLILLADPPAHPACASRGSSPAPRHLPINSTWVFLIAPATLASILIRWRCAQKVRRGPTSRGGEEAMFSSLQSVCARQLNSVSRILRLPEARRCRDFLFVSLDFFEQGEDDRRSPIVSYWRLSEGSLAVLFPGSVV